MSDEMAVGDKAPNEENKVGDEDTEMEATNSAAASEPLLVTTEADSGASTDLVEDVPPPEPETKGLNTDIIHEELDIKEEDVDDSGVKDDKHIEDDENVNKIQDDDIDEDDNEIKDNDKQIEESIKFKTEVQVEKEDSDGNTSPMDTLKGIKRRASAAFSDDGMEEFKGFDICEPSSLADYSRIVEEERSIKRSLSISSESGEDGFKGFDLIQHNSLTGYCQVLERLEAEVSAAAKTYKPLKSVMAAPTPRASKRARQETGGCKWSDHLEEEVSAFVKTFYEDGAVKAGKRQLQATDGSRPSSALSSRSEGDAAGSTDASSSPAARGARRPTAEMTSPLLRVPLERGWRRELVYRATGATADAPNRRSGDIYYYTPQGKKLRSTREISEHLSGTGLTLENFSFFKEPLGIDDPEKEIIRDAKVSRRVESPVPAAPPAALDGKRTPKPKPPKGASPEPTTPKSPPAKIKVKSMGSRLSSNGATPKQAKKQPQTQPQPQPQLQPQPQTQTPPAPAPTPADNNNTAAWKKPRGPPPLQPRPPPAAPPPPAPRDAHVQRDAPAHTHKLSRQIQQPCSMTCGRGVPSLACSACLCLYHPPCVGFVNNAPPERFQCKNCRKSSSPPLELPPLIHKSGVSTSAHQPQLPNTPNTSANMSPNTSNARRLPVPVPTKVPNKRVLLRMKVAGGGPDGERVWAVAKPQGTTTPTPTVPTPAPLPPAPAPAPAPVVPPAPVPTPVPPVAVTLPVCRPGLPQSLAILNGRRFIVVSRTLHRETLTVKTLRSRLANGAASPPAPAQSPRRRGRQKIDDTDHFTAFYNKAQENNYNVVVQIFQYLGMRDLARCGRVCKLWQQLAATPALWRHVRMKNSHVNDWSGLCSALKRNGTRWLDLRKMLLPPSDALFWDHFAQHIGSVDTLERLELCRCPARAVQAACERLPGLRALAAPAIRDARLDPSPLAGLPRLELLRLKSLAGLSLTRDLRPIAALSRLQHLSLTSIKELGWCACEVVGQLDQLESLELGECSFEASFASALGRLVKLRRLRLERGVAHCAAPALLKALSALPKLTRLELVNFDVKVGFDDALAECKNIQRLLIIPTYVSQSATTNKQVLSGVLRLKETLTHLMWGITNELLRVTELFIDQCEAGEGENKRRDVGECIPVLKPVPGCRLPDDHRTVVAGPPQVEILPIPTLQRLLSAQLPNTKLKLLRIPFHATWRQSLADFQ